KRLAGCAERIKRMLAECSYCVLDVVFTERIRAASDFEAVVFPEPVGEHLFKYDSAALPTPQLQGRCWWQVLVAQPLQQRQCRQEGGHVFQPVSVGSARCH